MNFTFKTFNNLPGFNALWQLLTSGYTPPPIPVPPTPIVCSFPLDASLAQIQAVFGGSAQQATLSNSDQTGSYIIVGGLGSAQTNIAGPNNFDTQTSATLAFDTGLHGIEWVFDVPDTTVTGGSGSEVLNFYAFVATAAFDFLLAIRVIAKDNGLYDVQCVTSGNTLVYSVSDLGKPPVVGSLTFDATGTAIYLRLDKMLVLTQSYTPAPAIALLNIEEHQSVDSSLAGLSSSITLRTVSSDMTGVFETSTLDPCDNVITFTANGYAYWNDQTTSAFTFEYADLRLLRAATNNGSWYQARASVGVTTGKYQFEFYTAGITGNSILVGVGNSSATLTMNQFIGSDANAIGFFGNAQYYLNNVATSYGATFGATDNHDVVAVALDMDAQTVAFAVNGTWYAPIDISGISGALYPMVSLGTNSNRVQFNSGGRPFVTPLLSGYTQGIF